MIERGHDRLPGRDGPGGVRVDVPAVPDRLSGDRIGHPVGQHLVERDRDELGVPEGDVTGGQGHLPGLGVGAAEVVEHRDRGGHVAFLLSIVRPDERHRGSGEGPAGRCQLGQPGGDLQRSWVAVALELRQAPPGQGAHLVVAPGLRLVQHAAQRSLDLGRGRGEHRVEAASHGSLAFGPRQQVDQRDGVGAVQPGADRE